ncbi:hypothetical protein Q3O60_01695 [Alkalimonas collagenimarina]|uniref:DUF6795 domain-containing protein n=1 Tax=Alkalimonas collagenimarina TaxID=400390 RepID=A0ABT9GV29_9GAMM|nr:DUF6795 domain-containing protein [Alkalimonas collagenimarina]MDP4534899.1 hypothetical protein [Alkalimonas collagenimarina]
MHKIFTSALVLMLTLACLSAEAVVFGWLKKKELQLSPEVEGVILLEGQALTGIRITRDITYGDEVFSDHILTGKDGRFSLPTKVIRVRDSMFDTNVRQEIYAEHEGKLYKLWRARALNSVDYKSFNQLLSGMICELTSPEMLFDLEREPTQPGVYLIATSICSFIDESPITNKEPA